MAQVKNSGIGWIGDKRKGSGKKCNPPLRALCSLIPELHATVQDDFFLYKFELWKGDACFRNLATPFSLPMYLKLYHV